MTTDPELAGTLARTVAGLAPASGERALVVTAVGAGGKTSVLRALARSYADQGRRVVVTTTTKMALEPGLATDLAGVRRVLTEVGLVVAGTLLPHRPGGSAKFAGWGEEGLAALCALADVVLVEGDGSRGLPVKAPGPHEPVVPPTTDALLVVAGLSALEEKLDQVCFRPELAVALLAAASTQESLAPTALARLVDLGYLRHPDLAAWTGRRVVVLNQADDPRRRRLGRQVAAALPGERVMMTVRGEPLAATESGRY